MTPCPPGNVPVFILFGPTASGKTALIEELFTGKNAFPAELVSADSMQVYRGMDIGTAKPSRELRAKLPHHLIDIRNPNEQFNAGEFVHLADAACLDIAGRGKLPVVSGGTGFYLKNFVLGLPDAPPSDSAVRKALKDEWEKLGPGPLMEELAGADRESASRIHAHDQYRLLRALEVYRLTGRPLSSYSSLSGLRGSIFPSGAERREEETPSLRYRFLLTGLRRERDDLYKRINERCAAMFRDGLPEEVAALRGAGYGPLDPGLRAIGYREFFAPGDDRRPRLSAGPGEEPPDLAAVRELAARNSRRYAKRQITFFASLPGVIWLDAADKPALRARELLGEFLGTGAL
ncbi:MAG: tRNA (adenosine(37)-N6)-dimethylallyltransferase MiaA [Spirochaetaceae bacterium]|jgi:tRNA dimethylallyltransferase|nr:tRNA (adenosine(37)-N6)-dimethylallyltransferase MiaA [Spirochaetaceae bacterium]